MMELNDEKIKKIGERFRRAKQKIIDLSTQYGGYSKIPIDCEEAKEYLQAYEEYNKVKKMIDNIRDTNPHSAQREALRLYYLLDGFDTE